VKRRVPVRTEQDLSRVIAEANGLSRSVGLGALESNRFATAVSELGRNILKYAGAGEVLLEEVNADGRAGVEASAVDRGPGIPDVERALRDHFSSGGTLGLGLPGVRRMMDEFEIDSVPGRGTTVTVRLYVSSGPGAGRGERGARRTSARLTGRGHGGVLADDRPTSARDAECAYFSRPCLGERVSGDAVLLDRRGDLVFLALIDGLGHGESAHRVATAARRWLATSWSEDLVATMSGLHRHLQGTIGAAAGFVTLDATTRELRYVGTGNVALRVDDARAVHFQYVEGTLGAQMRTPQVQGMRMEVGQVALMFSDGVSERLERGDGRRARVEPIQDVARKAVERFGKSHDDATCIALRCCQ
jgi:anti-sigma regulatory factor (Ser/Thr protein kinase)